MHLWCSYDSLISLLWQFHDAFMSLYNGHKSDIRVTQVLWQSYVALMMRLSFLWVLCHLWRFYNALMMPLWQFCVTLDALWQFYVTLMTILCHSYVTLTVLWHSCSSFISLLSHSYVYVALMIRQQAAVWLKHSLLYQSQYVVMKWWLLPPSGWLFPCNSMSWVLFL